jgi:hypothetical protein
MQPVLLLWEFDSDIHWAIVEEQSDIDRAMTIERKIALIPEGDPTHEWLESLGFEMFANDGEGLPPLPIGAKVITLFGY